MKMFKKRSFFICCFFLSVSILNVKIEIRKKLYKTVVAYNKLQDSNKETTTTECAVADCAKTAKNDFHTLVSYTP